MNPKRANVQCGDVMWSVPYARLGTDRRPGFESAGRLIGDKATARSAERERISPYQPLASPYPYRSKRTAGGSTSFRVRSRTGS